MTDRFRNPRDEMLGLELSKAQRELLLTGMVYMPDRVTQAIRDTRANRQVLISVSDLDNLAGHLAGEANHARDKRVEKILDAIYWKVENLLEAYRIWGGPPLRL